jgi:glutathione synthase
MRLAMVVNNIDTELNDYSTTYMAMDATNLGHEVWYIDLSDFAYDPDEKVHARARRVPCRKFRSHQVYLDTLRGKSAIQERIIIEDLDVLFLRNDPAEDVIERPWARLASINFGRLAVRHGVIVVNDPVGLTLGINKMYLQYFPKTIRPRTLISRNKDEITAFIDEQGGYGVLKPIAGSGGHNVFLVRPDDKANINQMIEAIRREGYVIAQEYLPEAVHGDTRLFMMNGKPLCCNGKYAAFQRVRKKGNADMRSNITAGAIAEVAHINKTMLELANKVSPKLIEDGIFLAGLDIVGDKIMEINMFSPGGLDNTSELEKCNFSREIILALERKVNYMRHHGSNIENRELAII